MVVRLDAVGEELAGAVEVMHRAFAEYSASGVPSGALLETVDTLSAERADGVRVAVALLGGAIAGMAKHHDMPDGTRYFGRLGVDPGLRGKGVARALVEALRADAHGAGLAGLHCLVRASEERNIALYQRLGMDVSGRGERVSRTGATIAVVEMRDR